MTIEESRDETAQLTFGSGSCGAGAELARPQYLSMPAKVREPFLRRLLLGAVLDNLFFFAACVNVVLLAVVLLRQSLSWSPQLLYLVGFWLVLTYLALPRMHRILTSLYVPDYFIGRTHTTDGLLGDPVNLAVHGTAGQIHEAMQRAGWTLADPITLRSAWGIVVSSLTRRSYPNAPVSPLMLFSRVQSFAYQQEVAGNPAQRHHVRFWATPDGWLLPGGHRVDWLAAGTYDRAVGLSLFTWQVTHKIDANIDAERDYIVATVQFASSDVKVTVLENFSTGYHSRNGGGDAVVTDGDLPVLELTGLPERETPVPQRESSHSLLTRPPSIVAGVLLVVAAAGVDAATYAPALVRDLATEIPGVDAATRWGIVAAVAGTLPRSTWCSPSCSSGCSRDVAGRGWCCWRC